jgi:hypothetical protein
MTGFPQHDLPFGATYKDGIEIVRKAQKPIRRGGFCLRRRLKKDGKVDSACPFP